MPSMPTLPITGLPTLPSTLPVLFVTGDKDDRCDPAHVRKMAARLLENNMKFTPVLIDYGPERGHSPVLPLKVRIEALALRVAFLCRELDLEIPNGDRHGRAVIKSFVLLLYFELIMRLLPSRRFTRMSASIRCVRVEPRNRFRQSNFVVPSILLASFISSRCIACSVLP